MPRKQYDNVVNTKNTFAALASASGSDSDSEFEKEVEGIRESPPFRVWSVDDSEKRFKNDTNIFSSPFSRKKGWAKPRFKEDVEGWVSIELGQHDTLDLNSQEPSPSPPLVAEESVLEESVPQEFPSMFTRGDQETAAVWAEKVKKSLERAEKVRVEFKRSRDNSSNIGTRLSFFRGMSVGSDKQ